jgi:hypothetical protein
MRGNARREMGVLDIGQVKVMKWFNLGDKFILAEGFMPSIRAGDL